MIEPIFDLAAARRILVVKLDEIGDFILATPFLRGLRAGAPQAQIVLAARPAAAELAAGFPYVDAVVRTAMKADGQGIDFRGATPADHAAFISAFRAGFDLTVVPRFDFDRHGASTVAANSRAPVIVGYTERATPWKASQNGGFDRAFTHVLDPAPDPDGVGVHEVERNLALLAFIGGRAAGSAVELPLTAGERAGAARLTGGGRYLAVAPGAASPRRTYPPALLAQIVSAVAAAETGLRVVVVGGVDERAAGTALTAALPVGRVVDLTGRTGLRAAAAVIAGAAGLIAMDSGPAHLAAATGTPVAVLSCHPTGGDVGHFHAPERFRPWGPRVLLLRPAAVPPCVASCTAAEAHCIAAIAPTEAAARITAFLAGS